MTLRTPASARKMLLAVAIASDELAVRIAEGFLSVRRPPGMNAAACLEDMSPEGRAAAMKAAENAARYFAECVNQHNTGVQ